MKNSGHISAISGSEPLFCSLFKDSGLIEYLNLCSEKSKIYLKSEISVVSILIGMRKGEGMCMN